MVHTAPARRKSTFFISEEVLSEMKRLVSETGMRSLNALVEEALREYLAKTRRELRRQQYLQASRDPLFLADIDQIEQDFRHADGESARALK